MSPAKSTSRIALAIVQFVLIPAAFCFENLPFRVVAYSHFKANGTILHDFIDLDGDGYDEIAVLQSLVKGNLLQFFKQPGAPLQSFHFNFPIAAESQCANIDSTMSTLEYFVSERMEDALVLHALWPFEDRSTVLIRIPADSLGRAFEGAELRVMGSVDCNQNGRPDLLIYLRTGSPKMNTLFAYDVFEKEIIWSYKLTGSLDGFLADDLDADGRQELILTIQRVEAGGKRGKNATSAAVLEVLDSRFGQTTHTEVFGGEFTKIYAYPPAAIGLPAHQLALIVVNPSQSSYIHIWDTQLRKPAVTLPALDMYCHFIADIDGDGAGEIVIIDKYGNWQAYDAGLRRISGFPTLPLFPASVVAPASPSHQVPKIVRLNARNELGIAVQFANRSGFMLFDTRLNPLASWDEGVFGEFQRIRRGPRDELFWATADHVYFLQIEKNSMTNYLRDRAKILGPAGVFLLILMIYFFRNYKKNIEDLVEQLLITCQSLGVGAMILKSPSHVLRLNYIAKSILELPEQALDAQQIDAILAAKKYAPILRQLKGNQRRREYRVQRCELQEANQTREIEMMLVHMRRGYPGRLDVLLMRDVTDLHAARRATFWAKTAQRLAHDLKNPLSVILMALDHLQKKFEEQKVVAGEKDNEFFEHIRSQVTRLRKQATGFMKFTELGKPELENISINELILSTISVFEPIFSNYVHLETDLDKNLPPIHADKNQLCIVLRNLIDNAFSAMPDGGKLTISTQLVSPLPDHNGRAQRYVAVEIHDTGCGIQPEILELVRGRQPFVTTKPDGTGVGLVQVQEIISFHQGIFEINSTPGVGTIVYFAFPTFQES